MPYPQKVSMTRTVISVEHLSKQYDLGVIGTGTLSRDLNRWWARLRKQPDPYTRIGQKDHFERLGESILALDDISFSVGEGEALGIIGRNGAGKSTLLKILSRVTAPTRGVVKVKGRIGSLLEVGTGFHPELTGRENVYLNGAILGMKKAEVTRKFDEIVQFAGVERFIDTPVKRYSSGMYVRLAFAVAAHLDPDILIVDEVLAVGDAEFQKKCLGKMGDVAGEGRTVLFVSHNMAAIQNLCNSVMVLSNGKTNAILPASDGIDCYLKTISPSNLTDDVRNFDESTIRKGEGPIQFTRFYCENDRGEVTNNFFSGDPGFFVLEYLIDNLKVPISNVEVSIIIYTSDGIRLANLWNVYETGGGFSDIPNSGRFVCSIDRIPFRAGDFYIDAYCANSQMTSDWILMAGKFHVTDGDFYGSGKLPQHAGGLFFVNHNWKVE